MRNLRELQENAQDKGLGIFKRCETSQEEEESFVAEFEPLEFDVETQWGDDGGKQIVRKKEDTQVVTPKNPGDIRGMYIYHRCIVFFNFVIFLSRPSSFSYITFINNKSLY